MYKSFKFRIYPNESQKVLLAKTFGCVRLVYKNFFRCKKMGYPRFKSKKSHHHSYSTICINDNIKLENGKITLHMIWFV